MWTGPSGLVTSTGDSRKGSTDWKASSPFAPILRSGHTLPQMSGTGTLYLRSRQKESLGKTRRAPARRPEAPEPGEFQMTVLGGGWDSYNAEGGLPCDQGWLPRRTGCGSGAPYPEGLPSVPAPPTVLSVGMCLLLCTGGLGQSPCRTSSPAGEILQSCGFRTLPLPQACAPWVAVQRY